MKQEFPEGLVDQLFDCLGDVVYCVKDLAGCYTTVNHAFAERVGANDPSEIIGKTASQCFDAELAKLYDDQDRQVVATGQPLRDLLELISHGDGSRGWYLSNKFPLVNDQGVITGVVAVSQDLKQPSDSDLELADLKATLDFIRTNIAQPLKTEELADYVGLSPTQLDRRMRRVFRLSTKKFVMKYRLELASQLLITTQQSLSEIALACGFSDQSAFTRHFGAAANQTPLAYRKSHQRLG
ncbi:AraC family transcriptional regulator [Bremerella cremea]|uniref:AraC family transcriptional regulator n=1 Tax=Bremerella cremea TaxID=1031537 RepID=A0A368KUM8_9BACT|nr:AraC family transcriptional regulator [Bremerella cremea]RCS54130.1 AraC family transcriptional regulator [Bremerella cremea]